MSVETQRYAYSYLVDRGFAPNAAAGIVGNLIQESGVDPHSNQVGGPGMGIAQWSEGERWQSLLQFAKTQGRDPYSLDLQLDFMLHEMKAYGIYNRMQKMNSVVNATRLFMNVFERPDPQYANLQGRIEFARTIREKDPNMPTSASGKNDQGGNGGGGGNNGGGGQRTDLSKGEYGFAQAFLEAHPEIKKLVDQADQENWTPERFQAELKETRWYKQLSTAQQQWSVLTTEHPGEARARIDAATDTIHRLASQLGIDLTDDEIEKIATNAARNQLSDADVQALVAHKYDMAGRTGQADTGQAGVTIDQIRSIASDYGVKVDNSTMERWTKQILSGDQTVEGLIDRVREQAKNLYPTVAKQLDTQSTRELLTPYMNIASDELGIPVEQMKVSSSKWNRALMGEGGPMNADQWTQLIRTDQRYGYGNTVKAKTEASQLASQLGQMFGARG